VSAISSPMRPPCPSAVFVRESEVNALIDSRFIFVISRILRTPPRPISTHTRELSSIAGAVHVRTDSMSWSFLSPESRVPKEIP
jgi:hypothetical protein